MLPSTYGRHKGADYKALACFFVYDGEPVSADRILSVAGRMMVGPKETAHQVSLGSLVPRR